MTVSFTGAVNNTTGSVIRVIVSTNVSVVRVILCLTVKPPIDQRGSGRRGCSAATHIYAWIEHLSFSIKSYISIILIWERDNAI
jgi:hypothetical protein